METDLNVQFVFQIFGKICKNEQNILIETQLIVHCQRILWYTLERVNSIVSLQVSVPLLKCTIGSDSSSVPGTPSRAVSQNGAAIPGTLISLHTGLSGSISPRLTVMAFGIDISFRHVISIVYSCWEAFIALTGMPWVLSSCVSANLNLYVYSNACLTQLG